MSESSDLTSPQYPRLLRRVRAVLIDSVIVSTIIISWWLMLPLVEKSTPLVKLAYPVLAILLVDPLMVSLTGASPGHHVMGVTINDTKTGEKIGFFRAILRSLLRGLLGWLSLVFVLTTKKHQALHDIVCRTIVLLQDPSSLPSYEKFSERIMEPQGYTYPSRSRRILVTLVYIVLVVFLVVVVSSLLFSEACLSYGECSTVDEVVSIATNGAFIFGIGGSIVFGWRAKLFGCRRKEASS